MEKVKDKRNHPSAHTQHAEKEICDILGKPPYDATVNKLMVVVMKQRMKEVEHCFRHFPFAYRHQRMKEWREALKEYQKFRNV